MNARRNEAQRGRSTVHVCFRIDFGAGVEQNLSDLYRVLRGLLAKAFDCRLRPGSGEESRYAGASNALESARELRAASAQDFFALWKDADPDIPILIEARKEYEKLK
jgi:hypothetical protein